MVGGDDGGRDDGGKDDGGKGRWWERVMVGRGDGGRG